MENDPFSPDDKIGGLKTVSNGDCITWKTGKSGLELYLIISKTKTNNDTIEVKWHD